jgi:hypothetical protein
MGGLAQCFVSYYSLDTCQPLNIGGKLLACHGGEELLH